MRANELAHQKLHFKRTEAERVRLRAFGPKHTLDDLIISCDDLLKLVGENFHKIAVSAVAGSRLEKLEALEELMHELAHHVVLDGQVDFVNERKRSITRSIAMLTPTVSAATELDALAVEFEAMWWIGYPVRSQRSLIKDATSRMDVRLSPTNARNIITDSTHVQCARLGVELAWVVLEETEGRRRYGRDRLTDTSKRKIEEYTQVGKQ